MRWLLVLCGATWMSAASLSAEPAREVLRDWVVLRDEGANGQMRCVAGVGSAAGDFRLLFNVDGSILLRFSINAMTLPVGNYVVGLQVDDLPPWTFRDSRGEGTTLFVTLPSDSNGQQILREILDGRQLKVRDNFGLTVIRHSLLGSGVALEKMLECGG